MKHISVNGEEEHKEKDEKPGLLDFLATAFLARDVIFMENGVAVGMAMHTGVVSRPQIRFRHFLKKKLGRFAMKSTCPRPRRLMTLVSMVLYEHGQTIGNSEEEAVATVLQLETSFNHLQIAALLLNASSVVSLVDTTFLKKGYRIGLGHSLDL